MISKIMLLICSTLLLIINVMNLKYLLNKRKEQSYNYYSNNCERVIRKIENTYKHYAMFHLLNPLIIVTPEIWEIIRCSSLVYFDWSSKQYVIVLDEEELSIIIRTDIPNNIEFLIMDEFDYKREFKVKEKLGENQ